MHNTTEDPGSNLNPPIFSHEQVLIPSAVADRCAIVPPTIKRFPSIYPVYLKYMMMSLLLIQRLGFVPKKCAVDNGFMLVFEQDISVRLNDIFRLHFLVVFGTAWVIFME